MNGMTACGKEKNMSSIIKRHKTDIGELKDIENVLAERAKQDAILEYIAACDHPEIFEEEDDDE